MCKKFFILIIHHRHKPSGLVSYEFHNIIVSKYGHANQSCVAGSYVSGFGLPDVRFRKWMDGSDKRTWDRIRYATKV
jgi:hypothetical protein